MFDTQAQLFLKYGDITDTSSLYSIIKEFEPDEIYNLAAQSHVAVSFETPEYTANCDALGSLRILESVRGLGLESHTKVYQASTSFSTTNRRRRGIIRASHKTRG